MTRVKMAIGKLNGKHVGGTALGQMKSNLLKEGSINAHFEVKTVP